MRRRGTFRRPFRRPGSREVPPELRQANALMESGQYAEAGVAFEKIATQAERRRSPRAPIFYLRAGKAYAQANQINKAMPHLKKGLRIIVTRRGWAPLERFGQRTIDELNEIGFSSEANEIANYLQSIQPAGRATQANTNKRINLPTHCPNCGAPLRTDEVEWLDNETAECIYCGNPVREEA
jgi:tetratricopeptide (TPR) repeat protein